MTDKKTGLEKFIEDLEDSPSSGEIGTRNILACARSFLAEEQAQKPAAPAGLMEELRTLLNTHIEGDTGGFYNGIGWMKCHVNEILSRYEAKPVESLADIKEKK